MQPAGKLMVTDHIVDQYFQRPWGGDAHQRFQDHGREDDKHPLFIGPYQAPDQLQQYACRRAFPQPEIMMVMLMSGLVSVGYIEFHPVMARG